MGEKNRYSIFGNITHVNQLMIEDEQAYFNFTDEETIMPNQAAPFDIKTSLLEPR